MDQIDGIATLAPIAREMFRGPRGIGGFVQHLASGGMVAEESLAGMRQKVMTDYGFDPVQVAMENGVPPDLYLRMMYQENRGRQGPVSPKGAIGLMQLMPGTAEELGVDPNDPLQNAVGGARYLRKMLEQFGDTASAVAAYNAGPGNVRKHGGIPPFKETQDYVAAVVGGTDFDVTNLGGPLFDTTMAQPGDPAAPADMAAMAAPYDTAAPYDAGGISALTSFGMQMAAPPRPRARPDIPNIMSQQQQVPSEQPLVDQYGTIPGDLFRSPISTTL